LRRITPETKGKVLDIFLEELRFISYGMFIFERLKWRVFGFFFG
jgi:hypothetical protein